MNRITGPRPNRPRLIRNLDPQVIQEVSYR